MINFNYQAKVGDTIIAYDFQSRDDCYMVGKVERIQGDLLFCTTIDQVWRGKSRQDQDEWFQTVQNTAVMSDPEQAAEGRPRVQQVAV